MSNTEYDDPLTDNSQMPFGKFGGQRMATVQIAYLHWFWSSGGSQRTQEKSKEGAVARYILANKVRLELEYDDGIW